MASEFEPSAADRLTAAGCTSSASNMLEGAAASGNPSAIFELAIWRLRGSEIARDLVQARRLLRAAADAGHRDAAMLEVALYANGTGASPDWRAARGLLAVAAERDPLAARHAALIDALDIDDDGRPLRTPAGTPINAEPDIRRFPALLTPAECGHLAETFGVLLRPSTVIDPVSGRTALHPTRRSDSATIGPTRETLVVAAINRRIAAATGTDLEQGEPLTLLRYAASQEFRRHHDVLPGEDNQRILTVIVYLNDHYTGGRTRFPSLDLDVQPRAGDAVAFANVLPDGRPDHRVSHAGLPVTSGEKWVATRWIRGRRLDPWAPRGPTRTTPEKLP